MLKYARRRGPEKAYAGSPAHSQNACGNRRMAWYHLCARKEIPQKKFTPP